MARFLTAAVVAGVAAGTACQRAPGGGAVEREGALTITNAYAAAPVTDESAAVYLTIWNGARLADTLDDAATPIAAAAAVHREMPMGAMTHMASAGPVAVPAGGRLRLAPGGLHLMLERLSRRPRAGDTIDVTLTFRHAGAMRVRVPVIPYADVSDRAARGPR